SPRGMGRKCRHVQKLLAPLCVVLIVLVLVLLVALVGESQRSIPMSGRLARNLFQGWCGEFQDTWIGFQSKCYYFSENRSDWNTSLANSQLLVPEDQGELVTGLILPSVGMAWTWLDGSRLDESR
uniref:Uncharacterized protein n=1 Tax=Anas zonorhyncha TaxID=75864 RepID=A0A8B9V4N6_9AVES